jgi:hypothetical protein
MADGISLDADALGEDGGAAACTTGWNAILKGNSKTVPYGNPRKSLHVNASRPDRF